MRGDLQPGCLADRLLTGCSWACLLGSLVRNGTWSWCYNGYNGGWPSANLFGWSAADWSRPATNKSIVSSERNRKSLVFCWERKSWTSWLLTCCSKKGWAAEISSKKGVNRKEQCLLMSIKTLLLTIITAGEAVAPASSHFLSSHQVPEHAWWEEDRRHPSSSLIKADEIFVCSREA